jgi:antitoxin ParD1/3/4
MRTTIDIDDKVMQAAMKAGGYKTKKETVEVALRLLVRQKAAYKKLLSRGGKLQWEGSLQEMRASRSGR